VDPLVLAREVKAAGLSGVGLADSPRLFPDPLVETARLLASDQALMAGPCVLSLPLMHVARAASGLATLAADFPARVVAVVGRGESSLANEGLHAPNLREYAGMLASLRVRLDEHASSHVLGAASGPRTIAVTAKELGGVLLDVGTDPEVVQAAARHARETNPGARVWVFLRVSITANNAEAREASAALLGSCAARMVAAPEWYGVTPALAPVLTELAAAHDYRSHGTGDPLQTVGHSPSDPLATAAGLVRERFFVLGTTDTVARRLGELTGDGIAGVVLAGGLPGVLTQLPDIGVAARDVCIHG
jgi:alkanesulfonate monooxygenase SsuD/methylene tetrahydromethanopterin reductase-like flavin-dependent oxidoreductase (luciferase family)